MGMERNTYAGSMFVDTDPKLAFDYLAHLPNLGEWTLNSVMHTQIDADTWRGSATGFHDGLVYHVRTRTAGPARVVEWHCGPEVDNLPQVYPVLILDGAYPHALDAGAPSTAAPADNSGSGSWVHWIAISDPTRVTASFMEPIAHIHDTELWCAKARLERAAGRTAPGRSNLQMSSETIYVNAPYDLACAYLADPTSVAEWSPRFRSDHSPTSVTPIDPLDGCADPVTANERAADLLAAASRSGESPEHEFWDAQGRRTLAALLHAAALGGLSVIDVQDWHANLDSAAAQIRSLLRTRSPEPTSEAVVAQFVAAGEHTRTSITATIALAVAGLTPGPAPSTVLHGFDEYDRPLQLTFTRHDLEAWTLIEQDHHYREASPGQQVGDSSFAGQPTTFHYPMVVIPAAYAFGDPTAPGVLVHRLFWTDAQPTLLGLPMPAVISAECVTIKRVLEERAGNRDALGKSMSYQGAAS